MVASRLTLKTYLCIVYFRENPWLQESSAEQYLVTVRLLDQYTGRAVKVDELSTELVLNFLRFRRLTKSARTTNNNRAHILTLWRSAVATGHHPGPFQSCRKLPETKVLPTAWSVEEFGRILTACESTRTLKGSWTPAHWRALLLVSWDTSHRLSAMLSARFADLCEDFLLIRAEFTKQKRDVSRKLHPQTLEAISRLPRTESGLIFPWPFNRRAIWKEMKSILRAAELPCTRRDLFHKLRRTAATHLCAATKSVEAAEQFLDHSTHGLASKSYLDPRFLPWTIHASEVMPRP